MIHLKYLKTDKKAPLNFRQGNKVTAVGIELSCACFKDVAMQRLFCNLIIMYSKRFRAIADLLYLDERGSKEKIIVSRVEYEILKKYVTSIRIISEDIVPEYLKNYKWRFFCKAIFQKVMGIFDSKHVSKSTLCNSIIGSRNYTMQVDLSNTLYIPSAFIFKELLFRLSGLLKKQNIISLAFAYQWTDILRLCVSLNKFDLKIVEMEYSSSKRFSFDVLRIFPRVELMNEFGYEQVASTYVINNELMKLQSKCKIVYKLHGVGMYFPYLKGYMVHNANKYQIAYYEKYNDLELEIKMCDSQSLGSLNQSDFHDLVLIHQPFNRIKKDYGCCQDSKLQLRALKMLNKLARAHKISVGIKFHPSISFSEKIKYRIRFSSIKSRNSHYLRRETPCLIIINSNLYFEYRDSCQIIFLEESSMNYQSYVNEKITIISLSSLRNKILSRSKGE